ncbi:MAG: hypothetical protein IKO93_21000 [Lentisphaeria bacterium]|nr:hypothetical protein [Lentisphaeria bacterium]
MREKTKNPKTGKVPVGWIATALEMSKINELMLLKRCTTAKLMQFLIQQKVVKDD